MDDVASSSMIVPSSLLPGSRYCSKNLNMSLSGSSLSASLTTGAAGVAIDIVGSGGISNFSGADGTVIDVVLIGFVDTIGVVVVVAAGAAVGIIGDSIAAVVAVTDGIVSVVASAVNGEGGGSVCDANGIGGVGSAL